MSEQNEIIKFSVTDKVLTTLADEYRDLTCDGPGGYASVKDARNVLRSHRIGIEEFRLEKYRELNVLQKSMVTEEKRVLALIAPVEAQLNAKLKEVDDVKKAEKAELELKEQERIDGIKILLDTLLVFKPHQFSVLPLKEMRIVLEELHKEEITIDIYQEFMKEAQQAKEQSFKDMADILDSKIEQVEREEKAEEARKENERVAKELAEHQAEIDAAQKIKDEESAAQQKQIDEANAAAQKLIDDERAELQAERDALEAEKQKVIDENIAREHAEVAKRDEELRAKQQVMDAENAKVKAEQDERDRVAQVEKDKVVAEERAKASEIIRVANLSDAEFIAEYRDKIAAIPVPKITNVDIDEYILHSQKSFIERLEVSIEQLQEPIVVSG